MVDVGLPEGRRFSRIDMILLKGPHSRKAIKLKMMAVVTVYMR